MLGRVVLQEIGKKLAEPEAITGTAIVVTSKPFEVGLYTTKEEPPVPPGYKRIHYGDRWKDLPAEEVEEWLRKNARDRLVIRFPGIGVTDISLK